MCSSSNRPFQVKISLYMLIFIVILETIIVFLNIYYTIKSPSITFETADGSIMLYIVFVFFRLFFVMKVYKGYLESLDYFCFMSMFVFAKQFFSHSFSWPLFIFYILIQIVAFKLLYSKPSHYWFMEKLKYHSNLRKIKQLNSTKESNAKISFKRKLVAYIIQVFISILIILICYNLFSVFFESNRFNSDIPIEILIKITWLSSFFLFGICLNPIIYKPFTAILKFLNKKYFFLYRWVIFIPCSVIGFIYGVIYPILFICFFLLDIVHFLRLEDIILSEPPFGEPGIVVYAPGAGTLIYGLIIFFLLISYTFGGLYLFNYGLKIFKKKS